MKNTKHLELQFKKKKNAITNVLLTLWFDYTSMFHRIPVYSDSDRNSIHIQEHSRQRSCRDRFHMETEIKKITQDKITKNSSTFRMYLDWVYW